MLHKATLPAPLSVIHLDQMCWHFQHKKVTFQTLRALRSTGVKGHISGLCTCRLKTLGEVPHFQQQQRITF